MSSILMRSFALRVLVLLLVFMTSCTYRHWVKPDEIDIRDSETVYRLATIDGDTVSFAGSQLVERERNRLTGVTGSEVIGNGGLYSVGNVSGVDDNGEEISYLQEDISAVEIPDRTAMVGTISIIVVSIPAAILVLGSLFKGGYDSTVF